MKKEEVFEEMIENKRNEMGLDPWVRSQSEAWHAVKGIDGTVEYKGYKFNVTHRRGGGIGMGEYPPTAKITILHNFG